MNRMIAHDPSVSLHPAASWRALFAQPYLLLYCAFLLLMAALSFAIPMVHDAALAARWPALGTMAVIGIGIWLAGGRDWTSEHWAITFFLMMASLSAIYADDWQYTLGRAISVGLLFQATLLGLGTYCKRLDRSQALTDGWWLLTILLVGSGFLFRQFNPSISGRYEGLHDRATGAGTFAALFLPIAIYQLRYRLRGGLRFVGWLVVGLLVLQLILSGSRTALLVSAFITTALWLDFFGRKAILGFLLLAMLAPLPVLFDAEQATALENRSRRILRRESIVNFTGRLDRWRFGLEQFGTSPLIGQGFGASRTLASEKEPRRFRVQPGDVFNLHSDQIEVLADVGIVGYLGFGGFWLLLWIHGARTYVMKRSPHRQLALAYFAGIVYAFVDTFMHGGFLSAGGGVSAFTWTMVACFLAVRPKVDVHEAHARLEAISPLTLTENFTGCASLPENEQRPRSAQRHAALPSARRILKATGRAGYRDRRESARIADR